MNEQESRAARPAAVADRRRWALAGLVCTGVGVAAGEFVAALASPLLSPVTAVGQAVIDAMPGGVKEWAVSWFGTADKAVFIVSLIVVMAGAAALIGLLERWRRGLGLAGIAVFAAAGILAVATRADVSTAAFFAPVVAGLVAAAMLAWVAGRYLRARRGAGAPTGTSRRGFLQAMAVGAVVAVVAAGASTAFRNAAVVVSGLRAKVRLPRPAVPAPPLPAAASLDVAGLTPLVTAAGDFYRIDTALLVPAVDSSTWKLTVTGMVERTVELDFAQLLAKPLVEHYTTIACVSNNVGGNLVGNARWLGWPVRELLAEAGVRPGADMVLSTSTDGFTAGTPLQTLTDAREAIIAVGMNGAPLPLEHGFPARLIVPGLYGYVSATKWVTALKVTTFAADQGYWVPRGWSALGPIKTASRIDVPRDGSHVPSGRVTVAGVAWDPGAGISGVQVQLDDGPWQDAEPAAAINVDTWVQWRAVVTAGPGSHRVRARARNGAGVVQTSAIAPPAPDGATGYPQIGFTAG
ncbi:molybdopterin-dependent oxidoreductase [Specibacter cremeus]|uniref:molybdopterin-dependent oxidoreductase n=1 Tax=Specibacter cremeus TaxID=1629051 RepID=UPI000F766E1F|nr:molybdopterin-dependent oxidoreductase [Specibacter cremeus]